MIPVRILGTGSYLPGRPIPTAELVARCMPGRDPAAVEAKTGIRVRHWVEPGTRISDFAEIPLRQALAAAGMEPSDLRRIILVISGGGDFIGLATISELIHKMGLDNRCEGFDLGNACMGFVSAFDLAARAVATGSGPIGIVAAEVPSRFIRPEDPRPYLVFADAAAAAVVGPGRPGEGILGSFAANDGGNGGTTIAHHPSLTHEYPWAQFAVPTAHMERIVLDAIVRSARAVTEQCGEDLASVDWVLPHQPNGSMLDLMVQALGIDPARFVPVVAETGSVVAASIPVSLDRLMRTRPVKPGDRILMIGVGAGLAYGAILYRVAP